MSSLSTRSLPHTLQDSAYLPSLHRKETPGTLSSPFPLRRLTVCPEAFFLNPKDYPLMKPNSHSTYKFKRSDPVFKSWNIFHIFSVEQGHVVRVSPTVLIFMTSHSTKPAFISSPKAVKYWQLALLSTRAPPRLSRWGWRCAGSLQAEPHIPLLLRLQLVITTAAVHRVQRRSSQTHSKSCPVLRLSPKSTANMSGTSFPHSV